jgi:hypothetical protein
VTDTLSPAARRALDDVGFVVIPGPIPADGLPALIAAHDAVVQAADAADIAVGRTTTRVSDFVNRGPEFDPLYVYAPVLDASAKRTVNESEEGFARRAQDACARLIREPYRLSTLHARTVRAGVAAQELHVDFARDAAGWPMVGFI